MLIRPVSPRMVVRHSAPSAAHTASIFDEIWQDLRGAPAALGAEFVPRVDVSETEKSLEFVAELPGVAKTDFEVIIDDGVITIRGEKKLARPAEARGIGRLERSRGAFSRSFRVPFDVEPDSVKGSYRDGVLEVSVPKPAVQQARTIPISAD